MTLHRRSILGAGLIAGLGAAAASAGPRTPAPERVSPSAAAFDLIPDSGADQTAALQAAIELAAHRGETLVLPAGTFRISGVRLRKGTRISGAPRSTILMPSGGSDFITADDCDDVLLEGLVLDGTNGALGDGNEAALLRLSNCSSVTLRDLVVRNSLRNGIALAGCSGRITDCDIAAARDTGVRSLDARGLLISHSTIADCGANGIEVWRSSAGEDGTIVSSNRISRIAALKGGSGQYGNGVNVFRAGNVLVEGNRIADCAYSAVRGNAASNIQIIANNCSRSGEVALYAEFGFEGALIANNIVESAAAGISVTNFNEGGRLAVVHGNLVRNLHRREHEPDDKRGEGIFVEADTLVSGNTIENAPTAGIVIGWGRYMRDVSATGNVIRNARVGILVTSDTAAGASLIANNLISGASEGAIRAMDKGRAVGPDLAKAETRGTRVTIVGNAAV